MPDPKPRPDRDGHCRRCGLAWTPDERSGALKHECPPGFRTKLPKRETTMPADHDPLSPAAEELAALLQEERRATWEAAAEVAEAGFATGTAAGAIAQAAGEGIAKILRKRAKEEVDET